MTAAAIKAALVSAINSAAAQTGGSTSRNRKLSVAKVIRFLIGAEGGSLAKELHEAGIDATPAAVSQRRSQIPAETFMEVFRSFNVACTDKETFRGYRLLAVDGTAVNMPRNPNASTFVCNSGAPNGYNQIHANPLYDLCNNTFQDVILQPEPHKDEIGAMVEMLQRNNFSQPTIIIADRGYESYNLLAHLIEKPNTDFVIRVKQNHSAMREIAKLPMFELDLDIGFTITNTQTNADKQRGYVLLQVPKKSKDGAKTRRGRWDFPSPYHMKLRIVRFQLDSGGFETIATSLPRSFVSDDIKEIYHMRWGIETSFRNLKYSLGLVNLHGKSDDFVKQEILASLTMFNFVSRMAHEATVRQPKNGLYDYKVNFKMAVMFCREYFRGEETDGDLVLGNIGHNSVAVRPNRQDNRNLHPKGFVGFVYRVAA